MHYACESGSYETVKALISYDGIVVSYDNALVYFLAIFIRLHLIIHLIQRLKLYAQKVTKKVMFFILLLINIFLIAKIGIVHMIKK